MADLAFAQGAVSTAASGTFDINLPSGFGTPEAYFIQVSHCTALNTKTGGNTFICRGVCDGTNQHYYSSAYEDGAATENCARSQNTDHVISLIDVSNSSLDAYGAASHSSFGTDKITLTIDTQFTGAWRYDVLAFKNVNVEAGSIALGTDTTNLVATSTMTREPDLIFFITNAAGLDTSRGFYGAVMGCAVQTGAGGTESFSIFSTASDGGSNGQVTTSALTAAAGQGTDWEIDVVTWASDGFTISRSASAASDYVGYLALSFDNAHDIKLLNGQFPTSGTFDPGDAGFTPEFAMLWGEGQTLDSTSTTVDVNHFLAMWDDTDLAMTQWTIEDAAADMNAKATQRDILTLRIGDDSGDLLVSADPAFDSTGYSSTPTTYPPNANFQYGTLFIAAQAGATLALGTLTETDSIPANPSIQPGAIPLALGLVTETDTAFSPNITVSGGPQSLALATLTETDEAFAPNITTPISLALGTVEETDEATGGGITVPNLGGNKTVFANMDMGIDYQY